MACGVWRHQLEHAGKKKKGGRKQKGRKRIDEAKQMQVLISDMLSYARVGTSRKPFEMTDADAVLKRSLSNLRIHLEQSGAEVTHDPLPKLMADPLQLSQVLHNL